MRRKELLWLFLLVATRVTAAQTPYEIGGHVKARFLGQTFADDSLLHDLTGASALDLESDLRLNFRADRGPWRFDASYQLVLLQGDTVEYSRALPPAGGLIPDRLPNDDRRLFDLTSVLRDEGRFAAVHRIDRLWIGYSGERAVLRFGRQAISWGNGLFFSPMDIVNPFDPTAVDTEYKSGDDMLYGQYLTGEGHDVQAALVLRRDRQDGDISGTQGTTAIKYHGLGENSEYDILLAGHYGDALVGIGGNRSIGGAVWRADLVLTDADRGVTAQLVTNFSYSWTWHGKNMSGAVEYYYNGFGQRHGDYDPQSLADNPELLQHIARGDLFTLARNYLAAGVTVEITPLWLLTPNVFANLDDPSAFLQLVTQNNLGDDLTLLGALNVPLGPAGTEYGGIPTGQPDRYLSTDFSVFLQLAWYF